MYKFFLMARILFTKKNKIKANEILYTLVKKKKKEIQAVIKNIAAFY